MNNDPDLKAFLERWTQTQATPAQPEQPKSGLRKTILSSRRPKAALYVRRVR